jgi:hypothetical protein
VGKSAPSETSQPEEARRKKNQARRLGCRRRRDLCRDGPGARDAGCLIEEAVLKTGYAYRQGEDGLANLILFASGVLDGIESCSVELDECG